MAETNAPTTSLGAVDSSAPSQSRPDNRPRYVERGKCTYGTIPALPLVLKRHLRELTDRQDTICNDHVPGSAETYVPCSECPFEHEVRGLSSIVEHLGDGTDGRKTSFVLADDGDRSPEGFWTLSSAALSYRPTGGEVTMTVYAHGTLGQISAQVSPGPDGLTAEAIQTCLASKLRLGQNAPVLMDVLGVAAPEGSILELPACSDRVVRLTDLGTEVFTDMIERLMSVHDLERPTPSGM